MDIHAQIPIIMLKEGDIFVCYTPAFDLASHGDTFEDAEQAFKVALKIFVKSVTEKRTWTKVLQEYGWKQEKKSWTPPLIIKQESMPVTIPAEV